MLERIVIEDYYPPGQQRNAYDYDYYGRQWTTGHFFNEAMKHSRLSELIQAGVGYRGVGGLALLFCFCFYHVETEL